MKLGPLSVPFFAAIILTGCNSGTPTTVAARNSAQLTAAGSSFELPGGGSSRQILEEAQTIVSDALAASHPREKS